MTAPGTLDHASTHAVLRKIFFLPPPTQKYDRDATNRNQILYYRLVRRLLIQPRTNAVCSNRSARGIHFSRRWCVTQRQVPRETSTNHPNRIPTSQGAGCRRAFQGLNRRGAVPCTEHYAGEPCRPSKCRDAWRQGGTKLSLGRSVPSLESCGRRKPQRVSRRSAAVTSARQNDGWQASSNRRPSFSQQFS